MSMDRTPRRGGGDSGMDPNAWMSTFSDLLMLMLTFFVLLLSMSSLDQQKVRSLTRDGLQTQRPDQVDTVVGPSTMVEKPSITARISEIQKELDQPLNKARVERVEQLFEQMHQATGLQGPLWVEKRPGGLLVNIGSTLVFEEGSAALTREARAFLTQFAAVVRSGSHNLVTETFVQAGDQSDSWADTWDLALRRADNTVNFMIEQDVAQRRLSIAGYGYAAGADEKRFVRHSQLLRFHLVVGPPQAEPGEAPDIRPATPQGEE
jgi:chemotaxis protein MotB